MTGINIKKLNKLVSAEKEVMHAKCETVCGLSDCNVLIRLGETCIKTIWDDGLTNVTAYWHDECYRIQKKRETSC